MPDIIDTNYATPIALPVESPRSFGDAFGAAIDEGLAMSPLDASLRMAAMSMRTEETEGISGVGFTERDYRVYQDAYDKAQESYFWIGREEAEAKLASAGLTPADVKLSPFGANQVALDYAMEVAASKRKRERAMQGLSGAGRFGGELLGSLADPVNLLTNFIPVIGQQRYARTLASLGTAGRRLGFRALVGFGEGALGAALTEPIVVSAVQGEGGDYTANDMLLNIVFGGIMGAGMHGGLGALRDWRYGAPRMELGASTPQGEMARAVSDMPDQVKFETLHKAEADGVYGREIDVKPVLAQHMGVLNPEGPAFAARAREAGLAPTNTAAADLRASVAQVLADLPPDAIPSKLRNLDDIADDDLADIVGSVLEVKDAPSAKGRQSLLRMLKRSEVETAEEFLTARGYDVDAVRQDLRTADHPRNYSSKTVGALAEMTEAGFSLTEKARLESGTGTELVPKNPAAFEQFADRVRQTFKDSPPPSRGEYTLLAMRDLDAVENLRHYDPKFADEVEELAAVSRQDADDLARIDQETSDVLAEVDRLGEAEGARVRQEMDQIDADAKAVDEGYREAVDCVLGGGG